MRGLLSSRWSVRGAVRGPAALLAVPPPCACTVGWRVFSDLTDGGDAPPGGGGGLPRPLAGREVKRISPDGERSGVYDVLLRNREWADTERVRPDFFKPLSEGQHPKYFCVSCADSRCPSEKMMGFDPGECFTVRNIANCVTNGDLAINSATQYAVDVLKVENILIVGHRDCGGIKAAMTRQSFGTTIDAWVRHVRDVYRQYIRELDAIDDPQARLDRLIELHVTEQCINIFKMGFVQRARRKSRELGKPFSPQIHGLVYDPSTGYLKELDIGLREKAREYGRVYDVLY